MLITDEEYDSFFSYLEENCEKLAQMQINKVDVAERYALQKPIFEHIVKNLNMFVWEVSYNDNGFGKLVPTGLSALYLEDMPWVSKIIVRGMESTFFNSYKFDQNMILSIQSSKEYKCMQILTNGNDITEFIKSQKLKTTKDHGIAFKTQNFDLNSNTPFKYKEENEKVS